jgi:hypothetical protein
MVLMDSKGPVKGGKGDFQVSQGWSVEEAEVALNAVPQGFHWSNWLEIHFIFGFNKYLSSFQG